MAISTQFPYQFPEEIQDFKQNLSLNSKSEKSHFFMDLPTFGVTDSLELYRFKWMKVSMEIAMLDKFNLVPERE